MGNLACDIRLVLRTLFKTPSFLGMALVILALGIGATSAIFSVVHAVLLRPLPYPEPERLVSVWETRLDRGFTRAAFTEANFWDVQAQATAFEALGTMKFSRMNLSGGEYPERLAAGRVSVGFFAALSPKPLLGRLFVAGEDRPDGNNHVVLLSHAYWNKHTGADPHVVGTGMVLDGLPYTVVGVLPPGDLWMDRVDVYVPFVRRAEANRSSFELSVVGRLAPGVTREAARASLESICAQLAKAFPVDDAGMGIGLTPATEWMAEPDVRRALWLLFGAVGVLLLLACVNLSNLMLARAVVRKRETAVRVALGADRLRLARMMLTEALVLSLLGAGLGLLLANGAIAAVRALDPGGIPRLSEAALNPWVLAFTLAVSVVVGAVTGLVPAALAPSSHLVFDLREGERTVAGSRRQGRLRGVLVAVEVALSLVLLVGAGLLVRSFGGVLSADRGFDARQRLVFAVNLPAGSDRARIDEVRDGLLERIATLPQVTSVASVSSRPLVGGDTGMGILPAEHAMREGEKLPWASWRLVTPDYFRAMGIPIVRGRAVAASDRAEPPIPIVLSENLTNLLWPGQDPIGRRATLWAGQDELLGEVVGVAGATRERGLDHDPTLLVYAPFAGTGWPTLDVVVHATGDPMSVLPGARAMLAQIDPTVPIASVRRLEDLVGLSLAGRRFTMLVMSILAGCALLLALAGIWGVQTHFVASRRAEIGVRVALGATRAGIVRASMAGGLRPAVWGMLAGLAAAAGLSHLMSSLLFGITPADALTYLGVGLLLAATAGISCAVPSLRALRVDPAATLKGE